MAASPGILDIYGEELCPIMNHYAYIYKPSLQRTLKATWDACKNYLTFFRTDPEDDASVTDFLGLYAKITVTQASTPDSKDDEGGDRRLSDTDTEGETTT